MSDYVCRKDFNGKNLLMQDIFIPFDTEINIEGRYLYFEGYPFCLEGSHVARTYFVWNGDGKGSMRRALEDIILFLPREREWKAMIPIVDESGQIIEYREVIVSGRYTPQEIEYIKEHFPNLVKNCSGIEWSDNLYKSTDLDELKELAAYLSR